MKRYNLTAEEYRKKFRQNKPELEETLEQFIFGEKTYLEKLIEMAQTAQTHEGIRDVIIIIIIIILESAVQGGRE